VPTCQNSAALPRRELAIVYDNANVLYLKNGVVLRTVATTAGRQFFCDSSFNEVGGVLNDIRFGPLTDIARDKLSLFARLPKITDPAQRIADKGPALELRV
jgi:hypothetical protein